LIYLGLKESHVNNKYMPAGEGLKESHVNNKYMPAGEAIYEK